MPVPMVTENHAGVKPSTTRRHPRGSTDGSEADMTTRGCLQDLVSNEKKTHIKVDSIRFYNYYNKMIMI